jgi:hypothetical protein
MVYMMNENESKPMNYSIRTDSPNNEIVSAPDSLYKTIRRLVQLHNEDSSITHYIMMHEASEEFVVFASDSYCDSSLDFLTVLTDTLYCLENTPTAYVL